MFLIIPAEEKKSAFDVNFFIDCLATNALKLTAEIDEHVHRPAFKANDKMPVLHDTNRSKVLKKFFKKKSNQNHFIR